MSDLSSSFMDLLKQDHRFPKEAYFFVFETLDYAQNTLNMGQHLCSEPLPQEMQQVSQKNPKKPKFYTETTDEFEDEEDDFAQNHVTGRDLCLAARQYAVLQYGPLARMVLASIGINSTSDIGEIVYNMIRIGRMRKTTEDQREDFNDVYDFEKAFQEKYRFGVA